MHIPDHGTEPISGVSDPAGRGRTQGVHCVPCAVRALVQGHTLFKSFLLQDLQKSGHISTWNSRQCLTSAGDSHEEPSQEVVLWRKAHSFSVDKRMCVFCPTLLIFSQSLPHLHFTSTNSLYSLSHFGQLFPFLFLPISQCGLCPSADPCFTDISVVSPRAVTILSLQSGVTGTCHYSQLSSVILTRIGYSSLPVTPQNPDSPLVTGAASSFVQELSTCCIF